jgi:hypothetical protein
MDQILAWVLGFAVLVVAVPLLGVELHQRLERRRHRAAGRRRTEKIRL